jgi:hypothetical protein
VPPQIDRRRPNCMGEKSESPGKIMPLTTISRISGEIWKNSRLKSNIIEKVKTGSPGRRGKPEPI